MNYLDPEKWILSDDDELPQLELIPGFEMPCELEVNGFIEGSSMLFTDSETGFRSQKQESKEATLKTQEWTDAEQDMLSRLNAENPGKKWDFFATHFPDVPKKEVKGRLVSLRKKEKPQDSREEKLKCIKQLKERLNMMEKELLGSCKKMRDMLHK